jgi:hypothetical protein
MERLAGCINRGRSLVLETQKQVEAYVETIRNVDATLDPDSDSWAKRKRIYETIANGLLDEEDSICQQMGRLMASFKKGLFVGGGRGDLPRDNLDLERWFRLPKGHERRIHGRCHAGVRIVQEGATLLLALDAHRHHPKPFTEEELRSYRDAVAPESQKEAVRRRKVMRAARSTTKRGGLLRNLEERYAASFWHSSG